MAGRATPGPGKFQNKRPLSGVVKANRTKLNQGFYVTLLFSALALQAISDQVIAYHGVVIAYIE